MKKNSMHSPHADRYQSVQSQQCARINGSACEQRDALRASLWADLCADASAGEHRPSRRDAAAHGHCVEQRACTPDRAAFVYTPLSKIYFPVTPQRDQVSVIGGVKTNRSRWSTQQIPEHSPPARTP